MNKNTKAWLPAVAAVVLFAAGAFATGAYVKGQQITTDQASGSNGLAFTVNGARAKLGTGTNDYIVSDGTNLNTPGTWTAAGSTNTGVVTSSAGATNATSPVTLSGVVNKNITPVGTGADTTEDNLMTYTLPGGSMDANTRGIRMTAWGDGVSTADVTTVRCYFGATAVITTILTAAQANTWRMTSEVLRSGAATQVGTAVLVAGGTVTIDDQENSAPGETLSGNVVVKCTGQRSVSSVANSVRQLGFLIEFFN